MPSEFTPLVLSFAGEGEGRYIGEGRHDFSGKTADLLARPAEIDDDVFYAALLQFFQLAHDLVGGAEEGAFGAFVPRFFFVVENVAAARLTVGTTRQCVDPHVALIAAFDRGRLVRIVIGDKNGAGDTDLHRVEAPSQGLDLAAKLRDLREGLLGERVLPQQHVVAASDDLVHRVRTAGAHPE